MSYRISISIVQKNTYAPICEYHIGFNQLFFSTNFSALIEENGKIEGCNKVIIPLPDYVETIQSIKFSKNIDKEYKNFSSNHFDDLVDYCNTLKNTSKYFIVIYS